jgi:hypothetical protein
MAKITTVTFRRRRRVKQSPLMGSKSVSQVGVFLLFLSLLLLTPGGSAQMKPGDRRKAFGEPRASVIESLLAALYPVLN